MTTHRPTHALPQAVRAAAAQRAQRAAIAQALAERVPQLAPTLDWQALDDAPPWLALEGHGLRLLRRRVGSVLLAPALRLWISAAKVNAARQTLGDDWWRRLLEHQPWPDWSSELAQRGDWPADAASTPDAVAAVLDEAGNAVLLSTMPHGALRHAALQMLAVLSVDSATATESSHAHATTTVTTSTSTATPVPIEPMLATDPPAQAFEPIALAQAQAQTILALTFRLLRDEATAASTVVASEGSNRAAGHPSAASAPLSSDSSPSDTPPSGTPASGSPPTGSPASGSSASGSPASGSPTSGSSASRSPPKSGALADERQPDEATSR